MKKSSKNQDVMPPMAAFWEPFAGPLRTEKGRLQSTMACPALTCQAFAWPDRHKAGKINRIFTAPRRSHFVDGSKGW
jgi:hypothetical protein